MISSGNHDPSPVGVRFLSTVRMRIPQGIRKEALHILTFMNERLNFKKGCLSFRIYQDVLDRETVMIQELWEDKASLIKHLGSDEYRNILLVADMASEHPEIHFHEIVGSTGMQTIEHALK